MPIASAAAVSSLTTLTGNFTTFMSWVTSFLGTISEEPILLLGVGFMVVGAIIRLTYKAVHGRG